MHALYACLLLAATAAAALHLPLSSPPPEPKTTPEPPRQSASDAPLSPPEHKSTPEQSRQSASDAPLSPPELKSSPEQPRQNASDAPLSPPELNSTPEQPRQSASDTPLPPPEPEFTPAPPQLSAGDAPLPPQLRSKEPNQQFVIRVNGGGKLHVSFAAGAYLYVRCINATLDGALQRIEPSTRVQRAKLECAPPRGPISEPLNRLGCSLVSGGALELALPSAGEPLRAAHLDGLSLARLKLSRRDMRGAPPPAPAPDLLQAPALEALSALEVRHVTLSLQEAPRSLRTLMLAGEGVRRVPAATLAGLTELLADDAELEGGSASLRTLTLNLGAGRAPPNWALFPALTSLSLSNWMEAAPARWTSCAALRSLTVTVAGFSELPYGWLSACSELETLSLHTAQSLTELPVGLLAGSCAEGAPHVCPMTNLTRLDLRFVRLERLPNTTFDSVPNLRYLDLSWNNLSFLPGGIFTKLNKLETLNLSHNKLADDVVFLEFGVLQQLSVLDLSSNPSLGDACTGDSVGRFGNGESLLRSLTNLTKLNLSYTNVTRICRDWREVFLHLELLDLQHTAITRLSFDDLQYKRDNATLHRGPKVNLYGSNVTVIEYTEEDAKKALQRWVPPAAVAVMLSLPLHCDCVMYRAARAIRKNPDHVNLVGSLACAGPGKRLRKFSSVPLDDMLCDSPELSAKLPAPCRARSRHQAGAGRRKWRVRLDCERANLDAMPALPALADDIEWDLRLAGNRIAALDSLPVGLLKLDLRNNSLQNVSAEAAAALVGASVALLGGNPLVCDCSAAPLLEAVAALRKRDATLDDREGGAPPPACGDGRALLDAAAARPACAAPGSEAVEPAVLGAVGAVLALLALAALGAGSALAAPARRARVKGVLLRWGWLPRAPEPADAGRRFDAFVSFAHEDCEFARALIARLESGPRALRLCVHSRDWAPGEYISAQIAASVSSARRTLCVVSRHYARSGWARAEFREAAAASAREGTPRLVLVLLEEPEALGLDRELRRYLRANTYLRADHPHFWRRLREALPAPRRAAPEPALSGPTVAPPDPAAVAPSMSEPAPTGPAVAASVSEPAPPGPAVAASVSEPAPPGPAVAASVSEPAPPGPAVAASVSEPGSETRVGDGAWRERLACGARSAATPA